MTGDRGVAKSSCAPTGGSEGPADDGYAEVFSNKDGSNCTSLGIYHCDVTYVGEHGKSLYRDGLEASNSTGRIGRSPGCPAIEMGDVEVVIPKLMGGSLLIHWKS